MILDTNFLGALDAGERGAIAVAEDIESDGLPARIPTPVVFEISYGIEGADDPDELLPRYEALFEDKPRVPLSDRAARRAGRLYAHHEASDEKRELDLVDAMVAAISLEFEEAVVTNDAAFEDVDGVSVRSF